MASPIFAPSPRKILVDTDPGGDDTFALLWLQSLVNQGFAEWVGVTTVRGNVSAELTFRSACQVLALGGFESVEVGRSVVWNCAKIADASEIHGADGMGNLSHLLPQSPRQFATARDADEMIIEALESAPGEVTVIGLGPLTNLAAAEQKRPGILRLAKELVLMAGAFEVPGNVTPLAEFNVAFNPEAAAAVLESREDLVMLPLDVTRKLILTVEMTEAIAQSYPNHLLGQFIHQLSQFMSESCLRHRETAGVQGFLVHDAVTVAYLFYPETLLFRRGLVRVETAGNYTRGQMILDRRHGTKSLPNAFVAVEVEAMNLLAILVDDLKRLCSQRVKEGVRV
ncbi:nucleoside hydrolase [Oscillatoria acuminata]|uniref:Inosine-uridine nucleoside N-ribohydrolase n=1 Tax=Oscillatoria acuminata PCC 6304 TaxID=56110 RepID=K9TNZ7_9CYAN|nr:nucleoside hydrolase [Oscillatoria acuminata]AFY84587.1 Inosine-uridine nucleoside N-ribohydrolase [Oscillatoria acuminata PCC 6304]